MKKVKRCLQFLTVAVIALFLFPTVASADGYTSPEDALGDYESILPEGATMPDGAGVVSSLGIDAVMGEILASVRGESGRIASFFLLLMGAAVMIVLSGTLSGELAPLLRDAASGIASLLVFMKVLPLVSEIAESLSVISGFFSALIPILGTVQASGGGSLSAGTGAFGMSVTLDLCALFTEKVLGLLVFSMFLSGVVSSFGGGITILASGIKNTFTRGIGLVATVLLGTLALQTLISATGDNMALRAARYATSGFIPVVGSTVAGALSTLVGGITYAKSVIGGSAISIIVGFAISPLVILLGYKLCFFIVLSFLDFLGAREGASCISAIRDALDGLISVYVVAAVVYVLEIAIILSSRVGV